MMETIYQRMGAEPIGACAGIKLHKWGGKVLPFENTLASVKLDGVSAILWDGVFYSLMGKPLKSCIGIERPTLATAVVFGELTHPQLSLEELSGKLNPNRKSDAILRDLTFTAFDMVSLNGYMSGVDCNPFIDRRLNLERWCLLSNIPYVEQSVVISTAFTDRLLEETVRRGGEGIVLRNANAPWYRGKRTKDVLKRVKELRLDLPVLSFIEGKGKRTGMVGKVVVLFNRHPISIDLGKGFTDKKRVELWEGRDDSLPRIAEVKCLGVSSLGNNLRLAKVNSFRIDKEVSTDDCL